MLSLIGALLILMSSYQLFFSRAGSYEGATLGRVSALEKVVKIKRARALDWVDSFHDDLVTENQMIYTDESSSAEVKFTEGQRLVISENSLVKIRSRGKENELDIGKGSMRATLAGRESFFVKMNGEDYELKGENADIEIHLHDNTGEIGVVAGRVELEKNGKTFTLDEKIALVVEGDKFSTKTLSFTPVAPSRQAIFYTGADSYDVAFSWTGESNGTVTISRNADLSEPILGNVEGSSYRRVLPPGHYFWKLSGEKGESLVSDFRIEKEAAPEILRPKNLETVDVLEDVNGVGLVRLEWEGAGAQEFEVETSDSEIIRTKSNFHHYISKRKDFSWRVRILDPNRPEAKWSEFQKLKVVHYAFPSLPSNLHPDGVEYQTFSENSESVELSWSSSSESELEIQSSQGTANHKVSSSSYLFEAQGGNYKWRVRGADKFNRFSDWSQWKEFRVIDMSSEKNAQGIQRIQLDRPDQEITFEWASGKGSNVFELSQDRNFQKVVITKEVWGSATKLSVPKTGTYFWRSREYRSNGTLQVSEPKKVIIEPVPAPGKPETLPPMEVPLERAPQTTTLFDFIIGPVYADDVLGIARIQLPKKENVKYYVLKIFRKGDNRPLVEERLSGPFFTWENALPGEYDFQYAVVDFFERQSPFSDRSSLMVKESSGPERPLLISPIRLTQVSSRDVEFKWAHAENSKNYKLEIYKDEALKEKLREEELSSPGFYLKEADLAEGNYFWRVTAVNERGETTPSSIGRFHYLPPKEELIAVPDYAGDWQKNWKNRAHISWAPSSDTYSFKADNKSGRIDGNTLMGLEARGTIFKPKWIYSGEFLRQSGKVFKKEEYSFMKLTVDASWIFKSGKHVISAGPGVGFGSGQSYSIKSSSVSASGVSGAIYGGVLRSFHGLNTLWGAEGKFSYLLGSMTELEISGNVLRTLRDYNLIFGAGIVKREYDKSSGEQTSLKLNAGIGREF